jgi:hypothetical protein
MKLTVGDVGLNVDGGTNAWQLPPSVSGEEDAAGLLGLLLQAMNTAELPRKAVREASAAKDRKAGRVMPLPCPGNGVRDQEKRCAAGPCVRDLAQ